MVIVYVESSLYAMQFLESIRYTQAQFSLERNYDYEYNRFLLYR